MCAMAGSEKIEVLLDAAQIAERVDALAAAIAREESREFLAVVVLKGSFVFAADLIRALHRAGADPQVDFLTLASYGKGTRSSGSVQVVHDLAEEVAGRSILLVDDILESGRTLAFARDLLNSGYAGHRLTFQLFA